MGWYSTLTAPRTKCFSPSSSLSLKGSLDALESAIHTISMRKYIQKQYRETQAITLNTAIFTQQKDETGNQMHFGAALDKARICNRAITDLEPARET